MLAEGKKPSGRALAGRVHIHRATCVEWLRAKQHQDMINPQTQEKERGKGAVLDVSGSTFALEPLALTDVYMGETGNTSPGVSPASLLPGDTSLV